MEFIFLLSGQWNLLGLFINEYVLIYIPYFVILFFYEKGFLPSLVAQEKKIEIGIFFVSSTAFARDTPVYSAENDKKKRDEINKPGAHPVVFIIPLVTIRWSINLSFSFRGEIIFVHIT